MLDFEKILRGILKKMFNVKDAELDKFLYEDPDDKTKVNPKAVSELLKRDEQRIAELSTEADTKLQEKHDEGYNKGKKESLGVLEKAARDKYGISSTKQGIDLIDEIVTAKVTAASKGDALTEEKIKASDFYIKESQEWDKKLKDQKTEFDNKINEFKNAEIEKVSKEFVGKKVLSIFEGLNPVLSDDATKAGKQKEIFLSQILASGKFKVEGTGDETKITLLDEKGAPKKDVHGHLIDFETYIKDTAGTIYDFKAAEDRDAPTHDKDKKPDGGGGGGNKDKKWTGKIPANQQEYLQEVAKLESKGDKEGVTLLTKATEGAGVLNFGK